MSGAESRFMKKLDSYLSSLRGGAVHSSGVFTLSPEKMNLKMAKIESSAGQSMLHLVQAGVKLGAEEINIQIGADAASVTYRGLYAEHLNQRRVEALFGENLKMDDPLTLGIHSAQATRIGLFWSRGGKMVAAESEGLQIEAWPTSGQDDCTLVLGRSTTPARRVEEVTLLRRNCGFCGVPISLDHRPISFYDAQFYSAKEVVLEQYVSRKPGETGFALPGLPERPTAWIAVAGRLLDMSVKNAPVQIRDYHMKEGESACLSGGTRWGAALLRDRHGTCKPTVYFLRRGVICDVHELPELGLSGARALVCADRLKTDAGGLALVRNEDYLRRIEQLKDRFRALEALAQRLPESAK